MTLNEMIQILAAMIGAFGFGMLFNIRGNKLIAVALGGGLGWTIFLLMQHLGANEAIGYFVASLIVSLNAEIMARLLKAPATIFIATSIIPLVPGASLYYTMAYALGGNSDLFIRKAIDSLMLAAAIAVGVIASAVVMKLLLKILQVTHIKLGVSKEKHID